MNKALITACAVFLSLYCSEPCRSHVTGLEVFVRDGQSFITWDLLESEGVSYNLYRSTEIINSSRDLVAENFVWAVNDSSVINIRKTLATDTLYTYCIEELQQLPLTKGLFVHTTILEGDFYYAVTSVQNSIEDTTIVVGEEGNSLYYPVHELVMTPQPVLQYEGIVSPGLLIRDYVHWGTNVDTDSIEAMASYPSYPYNFRIWNVPQDSTTQMLRFFLHSGEESFTQRGLIYKEGVIVITPDCPELTYPLYDLRKTFWFGYNTNLGYDEPLVEGVNVNYHERRLLYLKDWAVKTLNVDREAVYSSGWSYGACGSVILSLAHPDEIASILCAFPKLDFNDTTFGDFPAIVTQWGDPEDHIPTNDSLDT